MTGLNRMGLGVCLTVLSLLAVPSAKADEWNRKTVVTFSAPVEVPGVGAQTLLAGTYVFKVMDSLSDRHIVQIWNQDETHVYTTILAIPNYRLRVTDKTVITFRERPAGQPEALKAWFYPGHEWGEEFVYEKTRALVLAKESNEVVLATPTTLSTAPVEALSAAPIEAIDPTGNTVDTATVVETPPVSEPQPMAMAELPKTGSILPLLGLLGFIALLGGVSLMGFLKLTA